MKEYKGKTVQDIGLYGLKGYDDVPILKITFTDNSELILRATYGGYTGNSEDEYPSFIIEGISSYSDAELYLVENY